MSGRPELFRCLGALCEGAERSLGTLLQLRAEPSAHEFTEVFGLALHPYASIYVGAQGMAGGEARDRVAGFWRALRLVPPAEPDHLAALLALYASLIEAQTQEADPARRALLNGARSALLWEHLVSWLPPYLEAVRRIAPPSYADWASLLLHALADEMDATEAQEALPLHLKEAVRCWPEQDVAGDVSALLVPVRSGMILTRSDLALAATELGLGLRLGTRSVVLESLLAQDLVATVDWLIDQARAWEAVHLSHEQRFGAVSRFWMSRAQSAGVQLLEWRTAAEEVVADAP